MKPHQWAGVIAAFFALTTCILNFPDARGEAGTRSNLSQTVSLWAHDNLVAWCLEPWDAKRRGPEARAQMLAKLGFRHYAYIGPADTHALNAEIEALKKHGADLLAWYFPLALTTAPVPEAGAFSDDQEKSDVTEYLTGRHSLLLAGTSAYGIAAERCPKPSKSAPPVRLLIVTGGHEYEPSEFFAAFNAMPNVRYQHVLMTEGKPVAVPAGGLGQYDVVLFYDMEPKTITPEWRSLLERGKGFVFLHHALGSFPESPEFKAIVGGHANFSERPQPDVPSSGFHENQPQHYSISDHQHPATCGISDFDMTDEAYDNIDVDPAAHVLMRSDFPNLSHVVAWTWSYARKRVLYLQPGHGSFGLPPDHGPTAYQNESFRRVLNRGILWAAGRL
ncbi:MAG: ThuA domain-containing protein [Candidatus Sulfotelmatobacter sp.]|jgi:type 1 glutamine amidotransferase